MLIDFTEYEAETIFSLVQDEESSVKGSRVYSDKYKREVVPELASIQRKLQAAIENEQDREGAKDRS